MSRVGTRLSLASRLMRRDPSLGFDEIPLASAVRLAYNVLLEREPDDAELDRYVDDIRAGRISRHDLLDFLRRAEDHPRIPLQAIWPSFPPEGYLGQLTDEFQQLLAGERSRIEARDCRFYHCIDLPGGESIVGPWDLRGREAAYLGEVDVRGKRVLEMGPSSGYLSFWMEQQGAEVVGFDCGYDCSLDLMPILGDDTRRLKVDHARNVAAAFQYAWWYCHRRLGSKVKMAYGDVYNLPADLGEFDVSTYGSILLHLKSPIAVLEQGARRTRQAMVVTDTWSGGDDTLMDNVMRPFPVGEDGRWVIWWEISAGAVISMLEILGFKKTRVVTHTQRHQHRHKEDAPYTEQPMYTVVGERP